METATTTVTNRLNLCVWSAVRLTIQLVLNVLMDIMLTVHHCSVLCVLRFLSVRNVSRLVLRSVRAAWMDSSIIMVIVRFVLLSVLLVSMLPTVLLLSRLQELLLSLLMAFLLLFFVIRDVMSVRKLTLSLARFVKLGM